MTTQAAAGHGDAGAPAAPQHEALFYDDAAALSGVVTEAVTAGLLAGESVLVVLPTATLEAVRDAVCREADAAERSVQWCDAAASEATPARIHGLWRAFLARLDGPGEPALGVLEPVWAPHREAEAAEYRLHETLVRHRSSFLMPRQRDRDLADVEEWEAVEEPGRWRLLCPFDVAALPRDVVEDATRTHPAVREVAGDAPQGVERLVPRPRPTPLEACEEFTAALPGPSTVPVEAAFDIERLDAVRHVVTREGRRLLASADRVDDLALAAHELACNSLEHGGGRGRLRVWCADGGLVVEVADAGRIADPRAGGDAVPALAESGRGLWIARQLCDLMQVRSGEQGTAVRLHSWL